MINLLETATAAAEAVKETEKMVSSGRFDMIS